MNEKLKVTIDHNSTLIGKHGNVMFTIDVRVENERFYMCSEDIALLPHEFAKGNCKLCDGDTYWVDKTTVNETDLLTQGYDVHDYNDEYDFSQVKNCSEEFKSFVTSVEGSLNGYYPDEFKQYVLNEIAKVLRAVVY